MAGNIDKELLHDVMTAVLDGTFDLDEELKLALYHAIED